MNDNKNNAGKIILRSARIGMIICEIAKRLSLPLIESMRMFYNSKTCRDFHNRSTGLYLQGDLYVINEFMEEISGS